MVVPRASTRWALRLYNQSSQAARRTSYRRSFQPIQRRSYASGGGEGGHSTHKSSSDLPWAIGSIVVTVPSAWYLLQPDPNKPKHGHGHEEHGEHDNSEEHEEGSEVGEDDSSGDQAGSGEEKMEKQGDEEQGEGAEDGPKEGRDDGEESQESDSEGADQDTPSTSDEDGSDDDGQKTRIKEKAGEVQFKGSSSQTKEEDGVDTRKKIPDAKGGYKKRIESDYGKKQGEAQKKEQDPGDKDLAAASKPAGDKTTQSGKQAGLSNTDTKHSTDIVNDPDKSTKGEGTPETAKSQGTVDTARPQA